MKTLEHYLITIDLTPKPSRLHCYVMTDNPKVMLMRVVNKMMEIAEKDGPLPLPIILQTKLNDATAADVRRELGKRIPEVEAKMAKATDFHLTMWEMGIGDPWDESLMALH